MGGIDWVKQKKFEDDVKEANYRLNLSRNLKMQQLAKDKGNDKAYRNLEKARKEGKSAQEEERIKLGGGKDAGVTRVYRKLDEGGTGEEIYFLEHEGKKVSVSKGLYDKVVADNAKIAARTASEQKPVYSPTQYAAAQTRLHKENAFSFVAPAERWIGERFGDKEKVYNTIVKTKLQLEKDADYWDQQVKKEYWVDSRGNQLGKGSWLGSRPERLKQAWAEVKLTGFNLLTQPIETLGTAVALKTLPAGAASGFTYGAEGGTAALGLGAGTVYSYARSPDDPAIGFVRTGTEAAIFIGVTKAIDATGGKNIPKWGYENIKYPTQATTTIKQGQIYATPKINAHGQVSYGSFNTVTETAGKPVTAYQGLTFGGQPLIGRTFTGTGGLGRVTVGTPSFKLTPSTVSRLDMAGYTPTTRTEARFAQSIADQLYSPTEAAKSRLTVQLISNTQMTRVGNVRAFPRDTRTLGERGMTVAKRFAIKEKALVYGSFTADPQLPRGALGKGRGIGATSRKILELGSSVDPVKGTTTSVDIWTKGQMARTNKISLAEVNKRFAGIDYIMADYNKPLPVAKGTYGKVVSRFSLDGFGKQGAYKNAYAALQEGGRLELLSGQRAEELGAVLKRIRAAGFTDVKVKTSPPYGEYGNKYTIITADKPVTGSAIGDLDMQLKVHDLQAQEKAQALLKQLKAVGEKVRISPENPTLIQSSKGGQWHNAVDLHSIEQPIGGETANIEGAWGFKFDHPTLKIEGVKSMPLSEFRTRKAASMLTFREKGFAPESHRLKDIADYLTSQEYLSSIGKPSDLPKVSQLRTLYKNQLPKSSQPLSIELYNPTTGSTDYAGGAAAVLASPRARGSGNAQFKAISQAVQSPSPYILTDTVASISVLGASKSLSAAVPSIRSLSLSPSIASPSRSPRPYKSPSASISRYISPSPSISVSVGGSPSPSKSPSPSSYSTPSPSPPSPSPSPYPSPSPSPPSPNIDYGYMPPPPPPVISLPFFEFGGKKSKARPVRFKDKYFASVEASVFKIRGRPSKLATVSGLGIRPLKIGGRR